MGIAHLTPQLRQSANYWVALCLEGLVGQGNNQEDAINKLKEAIESFQAIYKTEYNIYNASIFLEEIHELFMLEDKEANS